MADRDLIDALAQCLEALRSGDADLEACLARYPQYRGELEALLAVATTISASVPPEGMAPAARFQQRTRRRLTNAAPPAGDLLPHRT